jgi:hypothetical protein
MKGLGVGENFTAQVGEPIQFAPAIGKIAFLEVVQEHRNVVIRITTRSSRSAVHLIEGRRGFAAMAPGWFCRCRCP